MSYFRTSSYVIYLVMRDYIDHIEAFIEGGKSTEEALRYLLRSAITELRTSLTLMDYGRSLCYETKLRVSW